MVLFKQHQLVELHSAYAWAPTGLTQIMDVIERHRFSVTIETEQTDSTELDHGFAGGLFSSSIACFVSGNWSTTV